MTARTRLKYPLGTIAAYGPDNTRATKLVAFVTRQRADASPSESREWQVASGDVRHDDTIANQVAEWLSGHRVKETIGHDRIIGCPHEEGIDYPMGRTCPQCPFWANIDRFTHEPIAPPVATMTPEDVLAALSVEHSRPPREALASADAHREALVEPLLRAIDVALADPKGTPEPQAILFSYALYLMAKWRETRAYPLVVRWLSLPGEGAFDIGGDVVVQDGGRILAAVCDGDLAPIRAVILNRDADPFSRSMGVSALARLVAWGEVPRDIVIAELLWLVREGLEREPSFVWDDVASQCADIEAVEVFPELHRAYADGLIDPHSIAEEELDEVEAGPRGAWLEADQDRWPPIDDVADATSWWAGREDATDDEDADAFDSIEPIEPYRAPPKIGRNEPCPCGSGKKYKKCCGM